MQFSLELFVCVKRGSSPSLPFFLVNWMMYLLLLKIVRWFCALSSKLSFICGVIDMISEAADLFVLTKIRILPNSLTPLPFYSFFSPSATLPLPFHSLHFPVYLTLFSSLPSHPTLFFHMRHFSFASYPSHCV